MGSCCGTSKSEPLYMLGIRGNSTTVESSKKGQTNLTKTRKRLTLTTRDGSVKPQQIELLADISRFTEGHT